MAVMVALVEDHGLRAQHLRELSTLPNEMGQLPRCMVTWACRHNRKASCAKKKGPLKSGVTVVSGLTSRVEGGILRNT